MDLSEMIRCEACQKLLFGGDGEPISVKKSEDQQIYKHVFKDWQGRMDARKDVFAVANFYGGFTCDERCDLIYTERRKNQYDNRR